MKEFWRQTGVLFRQGLQAELSDKERILSPLLFALTVLLLFSFAFADIDPTLVKKVFVAETYLTVFFALQITFARVFEPDRDDKVFELMRSYPVSRPAWFLAKYLLVFLVGTLVLVPTMLAAAILNRTDLGALVQPEIIQVAFLTLAGLSALGVLVSALTLKAAGRQILYPILYFPLTIPVLLAAVEASSQFLETGVISEQYNAWLGLLTGFDVIYFTLGITVFGEIVDSG